MERGYGRALVLYTPEAAAFHNSYAGEHEPSGGGGVLLAMAASPGNRRAVESLAGGERAGIQQAGLVRLLENRGTGGFCPVRSGHRGASQPPSLAAPHGPAPHGGID